MARVEKPVNATVWLVSTAIVCLTGLFVLVSWLDHKALREFGESLLVKADTLALRVKQAQVQASHSSAKLEASQEKILEKLQLLLERPVERLDERAASSAEKDSIGEGNEDSAHDDAAALPPLPEGVDPLIAKDMDLEKFLNDQRFNPTGKMPSRLSQAEIYSSLLRAKQEMEILESEKHTALIRARDAMETQGDFLYFEPGEPPVPGEPGVLRAAAQTESGAVKMFSYEPARFQEIYGFDGKQSEAASLGLRRSLKSLQSAEPERREE